LAQAILAQAISIQAISGQQLRLPQIRHFREMARVLALACLGGLSCVHATSDAPPQWQAEQCGAEVAQGYLAKDQLLLQIAGMKLQRASAATSIELSDALGVSAVDHCAEKAHAGRRRRHEAMNTCRRRHGAYGHEDSDSRSDYWTCNEDLNEMVCKAPEPELPARSLPGEGKIGWPRDGPTKAADLWCEINVPSSDWRLKTCPGDGQLKVKIISYNLFWWNLFNVHNGAGKSAGRLIARTAGDDLYDFMGFQECDDRNRVMGEAASSGLHASYATIDGGRAIAIAYLKTRWERLESGHEDVGEDSPNQYYGNRSLVWGRFRHMETGKTVFFANHHGPLKVNEGGGCTGSATALHIMKVIAENANVEDAIILSGDFNAMASSSRIRELQRRLNRIFTGHAIGGIDHVFTNCGDGASGRILGKGDGEYGSDHDAISAVLQI